MVKTMRNTTSEKKKEELYEIGQHIRVVPKRKDDLFGVFEGDIEALNGRMIVIKPDCRPHDGYRISIPWVDIKQGRYAVIHETVEKETAKVIDGIIM